MTDYGAPATRDAHAVWPSPGVAWHAVAVLTFAYLVSFVDRQVLSLLIEPIRADLGISDTQISLLSGVAFALLYTIAGIPIAWLADNKSRRIIIMIGVALWSVLTAAFGLAKSFAAMFVARVGIGVGEATLTPSAYSMISDLFPPHKLARPLGVYMAGGALGAGLALIIGGAVIALTSQLPDTTLPLLGTLKPWQMTFLVVASPGILVVTLLLTVPEPKRRGSIERAGQRRAISPADAFAFIARNGRVYGPLYAGFAIMSLTKAAVLTWTPSMFIRTYGWDAAEIGLAYGVCLLVLGPVGAIGGGALADWLRARGRNNAALLIVTIAAACVGPIAAAMPLMPNANMALALLAILTLLLFVVGGVTPAAFQLATPNQMRAQVSAVALFSNNLLGLGLGPLVVALTTDYLFGADDMLRYSLALAAIIFAPLAAVAYASGLKSYSRQVKALERGDD